MVVEVGTEKPTGTGGRDFILFGLRGQLFALDIGQVWEVVGIVEFTAVPKAPSFIAGVINYRGDVISIVDLGKFLEIGASDDKRQAIIIVQFDDKKVGVVVDWVSRVLRIKHEQIEKIQGIHPLAQFLSGAVTFNEQLVLLFDMPSLLSALGGSVLETDAPRRRAVAGKEAE